jgi:lipopolysaccharide/colanic/teichoic acid biosynthesis glycosyltransferase
VIRRVFDVIVAVVALTTVALPLLVIAGIVKIASPGPVLFRQARVGRRGVPFALYKFRTMRCSVAGALVTAAGDDRIYPVGRWLRKWKLDELPQFWNVLRGDMSIVGPRPEVERFVRHYLPAERQILEGKPGLASVSALVYANEPELLDSAPDPEAMYINELMPKKIAIDLAYEQTRTLWSDVRLLGQIALFVVRRQSSLTVGTYAIAPDPRGTAGS